MGLEQYQSDMGMCCRCSACKFIPMQRIKGSDYSYACPSIAKYNFHAYSGGGRMNIGTAALKKGFNFTPKILDVVNNCQICGACGVSCNYGMDMEVLEPIQEFRIKAVEDGHTVPARDKVVKSMKKSNTMVPGSPAKRADWAAGLDIKNVTEEKVDVLYHAGCLTSFDPDMWKLAQGTAKLLKKAKVNFGIAGTAEMCCGGRAYQMGYKPEFLEQAKKNMDLIKKSGVKTLVTGCADCYQAFKVLYDKFDLKGKLEVLHTSEYFAKLINEGKLKPAKKVNLTVTYHDPCRLGRLGEPFIHWSGKKIPGDRFVFDPPKPYRRGTNGVYEEPREVLQSIPGLKLSEMTRIKEYAWCCGAGGGVNESNPEFATWTADKRVDEAISTGAEVLATACPWCEKTLNEAIQASGKSLKVYDIVELLEKAI
jgi:Fe-S oxidoreductase